MDHVALDKFEYTPYKVDQKGVKLLFAGVLEPDRWRSLLLLVESLKSLREEGLNVSLDIYTFPAQIEKYGSQLDSPPASRVHEAVPFAEVPRLLSGADILVHVETFGLQYEAMITLSLSTKIPQYMAAGRAVLGIGAGHLASMQYLEKSGSGIVVAQKDGAALKEAVKSMVCDADLRIRLARRARQTAETNHDAVAGRERFRGVLAEVARSGS
jgi:glycosyltransferase involved in cell wall biosynthesis